MKNPTVQKGLRIATIGGSAILAVGAVYHLTKVKSWKEALMPALVILVSVSAFSYAMMDQQAPTPVVNSPADNSESK